MNAWLVAIRPAFGIGTFIYLFATSLISTDLAASLKHGYGPEPA
jgi:hypothetical protein